MNRKTFGILILVFLLITGCSAKKEKIVFLETPPETNVQEKEEFKNTLKIGVETLALGDFVSSDIWSYNESDDYVSGLIHHMDVVQTDFSGDFVVNNSVVESFNSAVNDDGTLTLSFKIKKGLKYSDGSAITAKDFVFKVMLLSSPQLRLMGANANYGEYIDGFKEFNNAETNKFRGIHLVDDTSFSVKVSKEYVDFFVLSNINFSPMKVSYWLGDESDMKDSGDGVYFTGPFHDMFKYSKDNINDKGKLIMPSMGLTEKNTFDSFKSRFDEKRFDVSMPSSGPYKLVSFDRKTGEIVLEINKNFPGDFSGEKPAIEKVIVRPSKKETFFEELKSGEIDLFKGVSEKGEVEKYMKDLENNSLDLDYVSYTDTNHDKLVFQCDYGPTRFVEVRQAIAHLIDKDEFIEKNRGGFASRIDGPYIESMWDYRQTEIELQKKLNYYAYSLEDAVVLIEKAGYILNKEGARFESGTDDIRYRKNQDGKLEPLIIKCAFESNSDVTDTLIEILKDSPDISAVGMKIEHELMSSDELYLYASRTGEDAKYKSPKFNMISLRSNLSNTYLPKNRFTTDTSELEKGINITHLLDESLDKKARNASKFNFSDKEKYKKAWMDYVVRWNEVLPEITLSSDMSFDFFNSKLKDYKVTSFSGSAMEIIHSSIED